MPSKNLLFICHDGDLYGSQQSLLVMLRQLAGNPYKCFVSLAKPGPLTQKLQEISHVTVLSHQRLQWVKHDYRSPYQKLMDCLAILLNLVPRVNRLCRTIKKYNIHCVHTNSTVSLEGALAAKWMGIPHVWHIRELFMTASPKFHMVLGASLSRLIIQALSKRVLCISETVLNQFKADQKRHPTRYMKLYNALSQESFAVVANQVAETQSALLKPEDPEKEGNAMSQLIIGYVGRISEGKGLHELLEALIAAKKQQLFSFKLLVAGNFVDQGYKNRINGLIEALSLKKYGEKEASVSLLGYQEDLSDFYSKTTVVVVPSGNEPFGRVIIEAMAHGVPCVGTNAGGIPELITHSSTGWLYSPGDLHALTRLLKTIAQAPKQCISIRKRALNFVYNQFNPDIYGNRLKAFYEGFF
ncbi:MAG: glycosyltransferase [Cyanobacteria bacterium P01_H01_bin.74]